MLLAVFLAVFLLGAIKFIPVLKVEGRFLSYSDFLKVREALTHFDKISQTKNIKDPESLAFMNLIDQVFLDILIEQIDNNIKSEAKKIVEEAILKTENLSLGEAAHELYGLSEKDFKRIVLIPQAKKDLLSKKFDGKDEELLQRWDNFYSTASIKIYYPGYYWDIGEHIVKKK